MKIVVPTKAAPLLDYADFALIADAYEAIPKMLEELKSA